MNSINIWKFKNDVLTSVIHVTNMITCIRVLLQVIQNIINDGTKYGKSIVYHRTST